VFTSRYGLFTCVICIYIYVHSRLIEEKGIQYSTHYYNRQYLQHIYLIYKQFYYGIKMELYVIRMFVCIYARA
jgi:hypothetical protein